MNNMQTQKKNTVPWRILFWEPVSGTGERLAAGIIFKFSDAWETTRILRDDVLTNLYGQAAGNAKNLIDFGLKMYLSAAEATDSIDNLNSPIAGLNPGEMRRTAANSVTEVLRTAALMYSSLARSDIFDEQDETELPQSEEVTRRFSTEVRDRVASSHPILLQGFGNTERLTPNGQPVKFGFYSPNAILHFSVLSPVRQNASVKDARAKLWELSMASELSGIKKAALISAFPNPNEPTIGEKQKQQLAVNRLQIASEADQFNMRLYAVYSAEEAANKVIEMAL